MKLKEATTIADQVIARLAPYCSKIEVAGSIRRRRPLVRDIDIVLITSDPWGLDTAIWRLGRQVLVGGKLKRVIYNGIQVDLYFATEETFPTILLIRTGSKENNIRLCLQAKARGMQLKASGDGIIGTDTELIRITSEKDIYNILELPYQEPVRR